MLYTKLMKQNISKLVITFVSIIFVAGIFWLKNNPATNDSRIITDKLKTLGAKELCNNNDAGKGLDNRQPWIDAFYSVPDKSDLSSQIIMELKQKKEIDLITTDKFIELYGRENHGIQIKPLSYENKPGNEFLIHKSKYGLIQINIRRDSEVEIKCESKEAVNYKVKQQSGYAVIEVDWRK